MSNFRVVILDYPKLMIGNDSVKKILGDMIQAKQINFTRTDEMYVPMSGLDMVGSHILIYSQDDLFSPTPVLAIRVCFSDRIYRHDLLLPIDEYSKALPESCLSPYLEFRETKKTIVDVNAWFVDPNFSKKNSGLNLSEIGFLFVVDLILKRGFDHFVGIANEKYKASRWVEPLASYEDGLLFEHPKVKNIHKLLLVKSFKYDWFLEKCNQYKQYFESKIFYYPEGAPNESTYFTDSEVKKIAEDRLLLQKQSTGELNGVGGLNRAS